MMKITGLSHRFKWENLHNWWLTKYFFAPLYLIVKSSHLYLYSAFNNTNCDKATAQYQNGKIVSIM